MSVQNVEKLIKELEGYLKKKKLKDEIIVENDSGLVIHIHRRKSSSEKAKRVRYRYRGNITFYYAPAERFVTTALIGGEFRSLSELLSYNGSYVLNRMIQHYNLKAEQVYASKMLAART